MNSTLKNILLVALAVSAAPAVLADAAKPAPPKPKPVAAKSVFKMPLSPQEGRDPFFPESTHPYEDATPVTHALDASSFAVKGISMENGRYMVIINNHTFAVGDEGDVRTTSGEVHVRLVEIRPNEAVIEVKGQRRNLPIINK